MLPLSKRPVKSHFSCRVIDKIFQKQTKACQCDQNDLSSESSDISIDLSSSEHSLPPLLTDTDLSDFSDHEISDSNYSGENLKLNHLYNDMEA